MVFKSLSGLRGRVDSGDFVHGAPVLYEDSLANS